MRVGASAKWLLADARRQYKAALARGARDKRRQVQLGGHHYRLRQLAPHAETL